jgi:hypothetical protein
MRGATMKTRYEIKKEIEILRKQLSPHNISTLNIMIQERIKALEWVLE